jgi:Ankyrin repeats (3 copies)
MTYLYDFAAMKKNFNLWKLLVQKNMGTTKIAVFAAVEYGFTAGLQHLYDENRRVTLDYIEPRTPLSVSIKRGDLATVEWLLNHGVNPSSHTLDSYWTGDGESALQIACTFRHVDVIQLLLQRGAQVIIILSLFFYLLVITFYLIRSKVETIMHQHSK